MDDSIYGTLMKCMPFRESCLNCKVRSSVSPNGLTNTKIYGVAPHWQSTSANIFFEQYSEASGVFSEVVEVLGEIASELEVDIVAWEVMAEKLSS